MRSANHHNAVIVFALAALCVSLASPAASSTTSWMKLIYDDYPLTPLTTPPPGSDETELYTNELHYRFGVKWDVGERGSWAKFRFLYGWLNVDFGTSEERPDTIPRFDKSVYIVLEFTYRGLYDNPWGWQARLAPSDGYAQFKDFSARELQMQGGLWGLYRRWDWTFGVGAAHTLAFGNPEWVPSVIAEYKAGEHWRVDAELPLRASVQYDWRHGFDFGVVARIDGFRYARDKDNFPELDDPWLIHSVRTVAGAIGYEFDYQLYLRFEGGYMFDRVLRLEDGTDTIIDLDMEAGFFYRWLIVWGGG